MANYEGPRSIHENELPELMDLLNLVFRSQGGDMGREYPRHVACSNRENILIIQEEGRIVSHVGISIRSVNLAGITARVAGVGAVATHPDARGRRYASILMEEAVRRSVAQDADIMLISGDQGVYRRMHAVDCGCYPTVTIQPEIVQENAFFSINQTEIDELAAIGKLWETHSIRYILPREDWNALYECKYVMDKPSQWWTVWYRDNVVGFGVVHQEGSRLHLLDWGGHPDALEEAAAFWFKLYHVEEISFTTAMPDRLPVHWRESIRDYCTFHGTVLVIQADRFLQRAQPFFLQRIGEEIFSQLRIQAENQHVRFEFRNESADFIDGGELARLFFGHPTEDILRDKLPSNSELLNILQRMFPIPLVWYGIGYV